MRLGAIDGVYVVLEDIPPGVRFSAGRCNGDDDTWSLAPGELEGFYATLPGTRMRAFILTVRVLTPDPCGYEYASTTGTFDVVIEPSTTPTAVAAFPRRQQTKPLGSIVALPDDSRVTADRRLAAARAEWQEEAAFQLERARTQWEATACERWAAQEAALRTQRALDLAEAEARWRRREADRIAMAEAQWNARAATREMRRLPEETRWLPATPAFRGVFRAGWILAGLVGAFGMACIALSAWT
jgi:hypothetical protein